MNSRRVSQFVDALERGDDAYALSLVEKGRVTIDSLHFMEDDVGRFSRHLIFFAVQFGREEVARSLVLFGANIDSFRYMLDGDSFTPACDAIYDDNIPALSLGIRLGANMSCVYRMTSTPERVFSGLEIAIGEAC